MTSGIQVSHAHRRYPHNFLVRAAVSSEGVLFPICASLQITTIICLSAHGDGVPLEGKHRVLMNMPKAWHQ